MKVIVEVQGIEPVSADSPGQFFIFRDGLKWYESLLRGRYWREHGQRVALCETPAQSLLAHATSRRAPTPAGRKTPRAMFWAPACRRA